MQQPTLPTERWVRIATCQGSYLVEARSASADGIGWLLRANRELGSVERFRVLTEFTKELNKMGTPAHKSSVSRWETGEVRVAGSVPTDYERLLGLATGSLVVTCDTFSRYLHHPSEAIPDWCRGRQVLPGPPFDDLTERACNEGVLSGPEWDRFTHILSNSPSLDLPHTQHWHDISVRLLTEMCISDGISWMHRAEAYQRLVAHPVGRKAAIAAVESAANDTSIQSMIGTLSVFNSSDHAYATRAIVRQVVKPTTRRTFYGALLTCAKKLQFGLLNGTSARLITPVLLDMLSSSEAQEELTLAALLVAMLPRGTRIEVPARAWSTIEELLRPAQYDHARRLATEVMWSIDDDRQRVDPILTQLIHESLYHPLHDTRLLTSFIIYSTPYRIPLAKRIAHEVTESIATRRNVDHTIRMLELLRIIGGPEQRVRVEQVMLSEAVPVPVLDGVAYALGHITGKTEDSHWRTVFRHLLARWRRNHSDSVASVLDRLVYAVGIGERTHLLHEFLAEPALPESIRASARWWTEIDPYLRASARN